MIEAPRGSTAAEVTDLPITPLPSFDLLPPESSHDQTDAVVLENTTPIQPPILRTVPPQSVANLSHNVFDFFDSYGDKYEN